MIPILSQYSVGTLGHARKVLYFVEWRLSQLSVAQAYLRKGEVDPWMHTLHLFIKYLRPQCLPWASNYTPLPMQFGDAYLPMRLGGAPLMMRCSGAPLVVRLCPCDLGVRFSICAFGGAFLVCAFAHAIWWCVLLELQSRRSLSRFKLFFVECVERRLRDIVVLMKVPDSTQICDYATRSGPKNVNTSCARSMRSRSNGRE